MALSTLRGPQSTAYLGVLRDLPLHWVYVEPNFAPWKLQLGMREAERLQCALTAPYQRPAINLCRHVEFNPYFCNAVWML